LGDGDVGFWAGEIPSVCLKVFQEVGGREAYLKVSQEGGGREAL